MGLSKCSGDGCEIKDNCLRFTAHPNSLWQSNIAPAYKPDKKTCWNLMLSREAIERVKAQEGK